MNRIDGTFEGGGTLGVAYVGALNALDSNRIWFHRVAGNSAGAITASMIAAGYSAKEIEWLSAPAGTVPRPASLPQSITKPIVFLTFLDFPFPTPRVRNGKLVLPSDQIAQTTKRTTFLWRYVKGAAFDEMMKVEVKTPSLDAYITKLVSSALKILPSAIVTQALKDKVKTAVKSALSGYPRKIGVKSALVAASEPLRVRLADVVVDAALQDPGFFLYMSIVGDGGIFQGDQFLQTMKTLIDAKVRQKNNRIPAGPIRFKHLEMDLALIATDLTHRRRRVFSKLATPEEEVAFAVRQSMSVPMVWKPVRIGGTVIVDGGVVDNFPIWLHLTDNPYVSHTREDRERPKMGFLLNEDKAPPASWNCTTPPTANGPLATLLGALQWPVPDSQIGEFLNATLTIVSMERGKAAYTYDMMRPLAEEKFGYYHVEIPLKGYSFLDFTSPQRPTVFKDMVKRGRLATEPVQERVPTTVTIDG